MPLMLPSAALLAILARPPKQEEQAKDGTPSAQKTKGAKPKQTYPFFRLDDDHPALHLGKGTRIDFRGRFAADADHSDASTEDPAEASVLDLGKKRLGISGEIVNAIEFQIEAELTNDDPWRDVYADFKSFDVARVRGGQFKIPFSLDENTGASHLDFMFRSLAATHLAPGRDRGVMVHGRLLDKVLGYEAGVFEHDGKNARTNNPDKVFGDQTVAARVTVEPLRNKKDAPGDLSIGVAFTRSDVPEGIPGVRGQTVLDQTFFSSKYLVNGNRSRAGVEMAFVPGPASIKAEWIRMETERKGESVEDGDLSPLVGQGGYVSGTYSVTGEQKTRMPRPKKPLLQGGFGAVEVGARVESLEFKSGSSSEQGSTSPRADTILGNRDQAITFGVNWYVNRFIKVQANFIREKIDDPSQGPLPDQPSFNSRVLRLQFSF